MAWAKGILISLLILLVVIPLLLVAILVGIRLWTYHSGPLENVGDVWVSEDGKITIVTTKRWHGTGEMQKGNDILEFDISDSPEKLLGIFYPGVNVIAGKEACSEVWKWDRKSSDKYVMTVVETTYFTVGETITFYLSEQSEAIQ